MKKLCTILLVGCSVFFAQEIGARYLIITHDNFYNAVQPLAQWKHKKGMRAKVAKLSETGSTATEIRNYIVNAYYSWQIPPEFLLLVGAPNYLPFPQISNVYTDNYYTNITGDIHNEILSGRLTVHNTTEAQTVINKILAYERTPYVTDSLWFRKACLIARMAYDPDDSIYWSDTYHAAGQMINNGYVTIDTLSNSFGHNTSHVISAVNSGRSIVMYRGAGVNNWYTPFAVNPDLTQNGSRLPIVLSITCRTIGTGSTPAAAERWLLTGSASIPRGASGYFATTTTVYDQAYLRSAVAKGFFDAVFVDNKKTFGEACEGGRVRVYQMYQYQGGGEEYYGFTTLGDPEMNLWTATPKLINVSHDASLNVGNDTLNVTVQSQGAPVESALVCVVFNDTIVYETGYTDNNGDIDFPLNLPSPGDLELTVTGTNLQPYEATIPVIGGGIYLIYENHTVNDSLGNNNGIIENGETILLSVTIKNIGAALAHNVSATVRSSDTNIVIIDSVSYYGDIPSQATASGLSPYVFSVSPLSPTHIVHFEITMEDIYNNSWIDNFSLQINGVGSGGGGEIGPDPYGYYIYDDTDTLTGNAPVFNWFEIAPPAGGPGTIIPQITNDDDDTVTVSLPFTFKYYGLDYNSIGICTNGFLEMGNATYPYGDNNVIPAGGGPKRMLAPFWDNLNPGYTHMGHGDIYQYHDTANHRWIMEFYQVAHRGSGGGNYWETFQTILLDPAYYPTPTGDGEVLYLYSIVEREIGNTVGIEDHTEIRGLQYLYNNGYHQNAAVLTGGRALLITTKPPATGDTSPWLYILNYTIDDSTSGNNNGIVEPSETIYITVTIENSGDTLASSVNGTIRLDDGDATLLDSISNFGDIPVDVAANNAADPFAILVSASPNDSTIGLLLHLTANAGSYETQDYFTLYIFIQPGIKDNKIQPIAQSSFSMLKLSPNPFCDRIGITYNTTEQLISSNSQPELVELCIYDVTGRRIKTFDLIQDNNEQSHNDLFWAGMDDNSQRVPAGVYFVQLRVKSMSDRLNEVITQKIIKLK